MTQRGRKTSEAQAMERARPRFDPAPHRPLPPPNHLSSQMKEWWVDVTTRFSFDAHDDNRLEAACDTWDLMTRANDVIRREGLTCMGQRGPRARPEVGIAREARLSFARLVRALKLDTDDHYPAVGGYGAYGNH